MPSEREIRTLKAGDIGAVLEIAARAWEPVFAAFRNLLGDDIFGIVHPDWRDEKKRQVHEVCIRWPGNVRVAEYEGRVAGFVSWRVREDERIGEIGNNAVHPDVQRRGIATGLYQAVLQELRSEGMLAVHVTTGGDPSHVPARRAYQKAGFERYWPHRRYYQLLPSPAPRSFSDTARQLNVRAYRPGDEERIARISFDAWTPIHDVYRRLLGDDLYRLVHQRSPQKTLERVRDHCARCGDRIRVAQLGDRIVGYVKWTTDSQRQVGEVFGNAVDPACRGLGIAGRLYREVLDVFEAEGMQVATVHTGEDPGHAPARRAYEKAGFGPFLPMVTYYRAL